MQNQSVKIAITCATGALIGSLIAIEVGQYLWWIGMFAGGFIGYLTYEFKVVIEALKTLISKQSQKAFKQYLKSAVSASLFFTLSLINMWTIIGIIFIIPHWDTISTNTITNEFLKGYLVIICISLIPDLIFGLESSVTNNAKNLTKQQVIYNPVILPPFLIMIMLSLSIAAIYFIPTAIKTIYAKLKQLVILIHSDIRLLCGIDAALGAGIGYLVGNAIIGAIAGGILGVINFEIISKRWLKIKAS